MLLGRAEELCKNEEKQPFPVTALKGCASVPFKWEEVPGKPKKSFMNDLLVSAHPNVSVAGVPFKWEEKPGKAKPFYSEPNPTPSVTKLSQKSPNSTYPDGSQKTSPKTLSGRLESISQVKLSRPKRLPIANINLPIQDTYSAQDQDRGVEGLVALSTWRGLKREKELFDEVYCMKAEGITESYSSKGGERRSSSAGCRTKASDAAPALFENRLQSRMEKYKVVPVENKQKVTRPPLVFVDCSKKRDSWVNMVENIRKHHGNGPQGGLTFHFMQPAISPSEIPSRNVHRSHKSITWRGVKVIDAEEDRRGPAATDVPSLDLGTKQHQLKIYDSSAPTGSKYSKHASKEPNHFQQKPIVDARMEQTSPQVFVGKYGGYSKRTRFPTKGQPHCMCNILHSIIEE